MLFIKCHLLSARQYARKFMYIVSSPYKICQRYELYFTKKKKKSFWEKLTDLPKM